LKKVGLTLGKFAPLHQGHQYMIETALAETDHVIVVIYDVPEVTIIPLATRSDWIRKLYPTVEVIESWDGPTQNGDTPAIKRMHEEYMLNLLQGRSITHFYSSEFYGAHMSSALGAKNWIVDADRIKFPISGTAIRKDPFTNRAYMSDVVYKDLVTNIVFIGAPSTGKTTLVQALAKKYNTVWMPEYGREYWAEFQIDRRLTLEQLVEIAEGHIAREEKMLLEANRFLFTDTNAITTYIFSLYYYGRAHGRLQAMAELAEKRYDLVFVCDMDIPYDDTWDRSGEANRIEFHQQILKEMEQRKIPFTMLSGSVQDRLMQVEKVLGTFNKY
jgi:HTH-type transcriptional regulator, transcriptional repressor of NAD biosynthesis genes